MKFHGVNVYGAHFYCVLCSMFLYVVAFSHIISSLSVCCRVLSCVALQQATMPKTVKSGLFAAGEQPPGSTSHLADREDEVIM